MNESRDLDDRWARDRDALRDHTAAPLPSLETTIDLVLASATRPPNRTQESPMSRVRRRPVLATVLALAILAVLAPVAYAVVDRVFLTVDPDASDAEVEADVHDQLAAAGVAPNAVHVERAPEGEAMTIMIDQEGSARDLARRLSVDVAEPHTGAPARVIGVGLEIGFQPTPEQQALLTDVFADPTVAARLRDDEATPAQIADALRAALIAAGFQVEVSGDAGAPKLRVVAPPI